MATTTIRVSLETHRTLSELAAESETSLTDTVRTAAIELKRRQIAEKVARQLNELRADPAAWQAYVDEAESTDVTDGIG